ncbi:DUF1697 domain-containing protein [Monashia sp. NPDC004114]
MPTYIGFLRAVNLGNTRKVSMQRLRELLSDNGFEDVETHIQSGNVKVRTGTRSVAKVEKDLRALISDAFGFDVPVVVRTPAQLKRLAAEADELASPIAPDARRYVTFMTGDLKPEGVEALHAWDVPTEAARVIDHDVVLFLADGVQGSRLSNDRIERLTGAVGTARNITVVRALAEKWCG